jgi:hypothetical protein
MSDPNSLYTAGRARGMLAVLIVAMGSLFGYSIHQRNVVNRLSTENSQVVSMLKDTRAQMQLLSAKLDSLTTPPPQEIKSSAIPSAQDARSQALPKKKNGAKRHAVDPRFKRIQNQLDAQGKAIESTREELASTRTDLQGSIARTHEELVVLQKKGERNYYEFDLDKSKQFQRTGPVGISLRKSNTKHMYADLELRVNDAQISKKHVNLFEPAYFYAADEGRPVELVINSIRKNHIHGYISAPKYASSELAAASSANSSDSPSSGSQPGAQDSTPRQRRKLELPKTN